MIDMTRQIFLVIGRNRFRERDFEFLEFINLNFVMLVFFMELAIMIWSDK
jgi:hypothetical protein